MSDLSHQYRDVTNRLARAVERSGRDPSDVTLVAVSKGRSPASIEALYELGHRDFGENRAQELRDKVPALPADIRWHFVGPLQSNKVRTVRPAVFALHSMDRMSLATVWMKGAGRPPSVYLQVNIGNEEQKSGVAADEVRDGLAELDLLSLPVVGIMAIPPLTEDAESSRRYFVALRELRDRLVDEYPTVTGLSMGMSNDFDVAAEEGSTAVRVGRAIFQD